MPDNPAQGAQPTRRRHESRLFSCDWGTSHFRLRAVEGGDARVLAEVRSDQGVSRLASQPLQQRAASYRQVLTQAVQELVSQIPADAPEEDWRRAPIVISGMASSSLGWRELPYARLPLALDGQGLIWQFVEQISEQQGEWPVYLVSGARTEHEVMRGEETQILGAFQLSHTRPLAARSLVILPGTHSKHVQVVAGKITDFETFMTGELYAVLGEHSILRHSLTGAERAASAEPAAMEAFCAGVEQAQYTPLTAALFQVRTRQLLAAASPNDNAAFLSGLLIGSELGYLAATDAPDWPLLLCAPATLAVPYGAALDFLGLNATVVPPEDVERLTPLGQLALLRNQI